MAPRHQRSPQSRRTRHDLQVYLAARRTSGSLAADAQTARCQRLPRDAVYGPECHHLRSRQWRMALQDPERRTRLVQGNSPDAGSRHRTLPRGGRLHGDRRRTGGGGRGRSGHSPRHPRDCWRGRRALVRGGLGRCPGRRGSHLSGDKFMGGHPPGRSSREPLRGDGHALRRRAREIHPHRHPGNRRGVHGVGAQQNSRRRSGLRHPEPPGRRVRTRRRRSLFLPLVNGRARPGG